jgi:hypothetical protein
MAELDEICEPNVAFDREEGTTGISAAGIAIRDPFGAGRTWGTRWCSAACASSQARVPVALPSHDPSASSATAASASGSTGGRRPRADQGMHGRERPRDARTWPPTETRLGMGERRPMTDATAATCVHGEGE